MALQGGGTVFALSSAVGRAGVAIIRISGGDAHAAALQLLQPPPPPPLAPPPPTPPTPPSGASAKGPRGGGLPPQRYAATRTLRDPRDGTVLDQALVLRFDGPASFTGEVCRRLMTEQRPCFAPFYTLVPTARLCSSPRLADRMWLSCTCTAAWPSSPARWKPLAASPACGRPPLVNLRAAPLPTTKWT